jgi:hypothetical protein
MRCGAIQLAYAARSLTPGVESEALAKQGTVQDRESKSKVARKFFLRDICLGESI